MSSHTKKTSPTITLPIETTTSPSSLVSTPSVSQIPTAASGLTATLPVTGPSTTALPNPTSPPQVTSPVPSALDGPPTVEIPAVPTGYVVANRHSVLGYYPNKTELAAASAVVSDLGKFAAYTSVLGSTAPDASALVAAVTVGLNWRTLRNSCEAYTSFVKSQDAIAWKTALTLLDELKPLFLLAVVKNPTLATEYPGLTAMFNATKVIAKSAATTRVKNAKAKADAAAKAIPAATTTATEAPGGAPKVTINT